MIWWERTLWKKNRAVSPAYLHRSGRLAKLMWIKGSYAASKWPTATMWPMVLQIGGDKGWAGLGHVSSRSRHLKNS